MTRTPLSVTASTRGLCCVKAVLQAWVLRLPSVYLRKTPRSLLHLAISRSVRSNSSGLLKLTILALAGNKIELHCRAAAEIKSQGGKGRIEAMELDLTSFRCVYAAIRKGLHCELRVVPQDVDYCRTVFYITHHAGIKHLCKHSCAACANVACLYLCYLTKTE